MKRATNPDFSDVWAALCAEGVRQSTEPRGTKDLDLLVRPDPKVLIRNKGACGRPQDLLDVIAVVRALARRSGQRG